MKTEYESYQYRDGVGHPADPSERKVRVSGNPINIRGRARHDYGSYANANHMTNNMPSREYDRMNTQFNQEEIDLESSPVEYGRRSVRSNDEQTWDRSNNESYVWQDSGYQEHHDNHRGKGPKGYKRTDERISEDIHERLSDDNFLDASNIEVSVKNGEVILTGTVAERVDKRRAEDISEGVLGVTHLENRIRVQRLG